MTADSRGPAAPAPLDPKLRRAMPSAEFLEKYESIGHWCPQGDRVRPYSFAVCSMCMGRDAVQIVQLRGAVQAERAREPDDTSEARLRHLRSVVRQLAHALENATYGVGDSLGGDP